MDSTWGDVERSGDGRPRVERERLARLGHPSAYAIEPQAIDMAPRPGFSSRVTSPDCMTGQESGTETPGDRLVSQRHAADGALPARLEAEGRDAALAMGDCKVMTADGSVSERCKPKESLLTPFLHADQFHAIMTPLFYVRLSHPFRDQVQRAPVEGRPRESRQRTRGYRR